MGTFSNLSHYITFKTKKLRLYYIAGTTILCSIFYLIGIWCQGGPSAGAASLGPCNITASASASNKPLDFTAHHSAGDLLQAPSTAARPIRLPPCDPKFSEYTPCEDVDRSLKFDRDRLIYRERHCPVRDELLKCRIAAPYGYQQPVRWPESRRSVWYANVPHKHLTVEKAGQNWVRFEGDRFGFPGGGTMFPHGADVYIDEIGKLINLRDGSIRTAIDTGCGVASLGAYLLSRDILTMSFAPRDTHEAQVQFALERGVPALIGVLASIRLPYPSRAFDMAHCSRCLIPWGQYDGIYLIEVDRILRPGGYWILSGPPINWEKHWKGWQRTWDDLKAEQDVIESVARSLCWKKLVQRDDLAIWQKPTNHIHCKINRKVFKKPRFCQAQDPDEAWYTKMETCLTPLPEASDIKEIAGGELAKWPERLTAVPPRITSGSLEGITAEVFAHDTELWKKRLSTYKAFDYQLAQKGRYRNLLDMNSHLGGLAAALVDDPVWVMNIVPVEAKVNTLGVIYERGLIGTYQNWCEAMSTYPRTYDFIHAHSVFSLYKDRCDAEDILLEMDRILRPQGSVMIRDDVDVLVNLKAIANELQWESRMVDGEGGPHGREKLLFAVKTYWTSPQADEQNQQGSNTVS
ncbi:S-adenosyl-L-methionine-dependent methyltransferases superfamily protein [Actinidia rufa]|uniref:Methyltransferase n=1 Tax=Actinidia rufa TaxID=165716 RepID=A0A7J0HD61_9ERIC|nr:S-adenosyl-L-methionine-dependent methyltransferases superfamily protein [Actinidia rufa]